MSDEQLDDFGDFLMGSDADGSDDPLPEVPAASTLTAISTADVETDDEDLAVFFSENKLDRGLSKPWMKFHRFNLVKTVDEVKAIVDSALAHGRCALDLETEGFDNRVDYDANGGLSTRHKIVGYCISVKGVGYYIPVRHRFNTTYGEKDPNVPLAGVDAEIRRLCEASQPILTEEGLREDPLGSVKIATPPRCLIYFWNAKFDQEFLYPVCGFEVWHPASFEDGMLAAYTYYSDASLGLKDNAESCLRIKDPETGDVHPYQMIHFDDLFDSRIPKKKRFFYNLYPEEGSAEVLYGCSDAICTEALCEAKGEWEHTVSNVKFEYENFITKVKKVGGDFTYVLEKQVTQAIRDMERQRVRIDKTAINEILKEAQIELARLNDLIVELAKSKGFGDDFNPGSPKQLSDFLFTKKGLDITPKPATSSEGSEQYKTDAKTLEEMSEHEGAPEVLRWIVNFRQVDKVIGTYLTSMSENCDELEQLRFKFSQTGAATGRFTAPAGEPDHGYGGVPPQGIPGKDDPKKPKVAHSLRSAFVPRDGYTMCKCDYAAQELRVVTNLCGEPVWENEFIHGTGDLHTITAKAFFGAHITKDNKLERGMGKTANFALIYGGGTGAVQRATGCDKMEAARRKANFDKAVPVFAGWVKAQHEKVKKTLGVRNPFGRFISIPDANLKFGDKNAKGEAIPMEDIKKIRAACERKSTNYPVQSAGADIMKISLVRLLKEFHRRGWRRQGGDDSVRMIMTVHDEVVFEIRHDRVFEVVPIIIEIMEAPSKMAKWKIPLVVEPQLGLSWNAKYDWPDVISGKKIPAWLEGIAPAAQATPIIDVPKIEVTPVKSSTPTGRGPVKGTIRVATFILSRTYLREEMVSKVYGAMAESLDPSSQVYLKLVDNAGEVIVDPVEDRYPIDAEAFKVKFKDRCLGFDQYEVKDLPI